MYLLEFLASRLGQRVASPGGLGGECVDLVELWALANGAHGVPGNAAELLRNADRSQWEVVSNTPYNFPSTGDVVVWQQNSSQGISRYGHTAVCVAADGTWLLSADQNWPQGAPVGFKLHSYAGVAGWLRRK